MNRKYEELVEYIRKLEKVVLAFSGGVDSSFLLKAAKDALGEDLKAVTVVSPYIPAWEVEEAKELSKAMNVDHQFIFVDIIDEIKNNPQDRCYTCKKAIFGKIIESANEGGYKYVIDGSNFDDTKDYRPGMIALKELKVASPLLACEITKDEIREMSKDLNLSTWNKPAYACLLTRIPHDTLITIEELKRIEESETYLINRGIRAVRVRSHGELARIEVDPSQRNVMFKEEILDEISEKLKSFGYKYVTLDMAGYKMGSFNN